MGSKLSQVLAPSFDSVVYVHKGKVLLILDWKEKFAKMHFHVRRICRRAMASADHKMKVKSSMVSTAKNEEISSPQLTLTSEPNQSRRVMGSERCHFSLFYCSGTEMTKSDTKRSFSKCYTPYLFKKYCFTFALVTQHNHRKISRLVTVFPYAFRLTILVTL